MTSATELLKCPFCGGKAHIAECVGYRGDVSYTVNCDAIHDCIASDSGFWYSSREAAIAAWNTRATLGSGKVVSRELVQQVICKFGIDYTAIADELNATLGKVVEP